MTVVPDMTLWTGRIDAAEGQGALRWHQWIKPLAPGMPAGAALIGLASDEGVKRNQGRTGARLGPPALRSALANLAWHGSAPLYDAGDVACVGSDLEGAQHAYAAQVTELLTQGHLPLGLGRHEIAFASFSGLADYLRGQTPHRASAFSILMRTLTCATPSKAVPVRPSGKSPSTASAPTCRLRIAAWASAS